MTKDIVIAELQEKVFSGDKQAVETNNEYVSRRYMQLWGQLSIINVI